MHTYAALASSDPCSKLSGEHDLIHQKYEKADRDRYGRESHGGHVGRVTSGIGAAPGMVSHDTRNTSCSAVDRVTIMIAFGSPRDSWRPAGDPVTWEPDGSQASFESVVEDSG